MRTPRVLWILFLSLLTSAPAWSTTYNFTTANSESSIWATAFHSGDVVNFAAGTYNWSGSHGLTCGVTYSGPAGATAFGNVFNPGQDMTANTPTQPTMIINSSNGGGIFNISGCSSSSATTTLEWMWGQNINMLYNDGTASNVLFQHNWCTNILPNSLNSGQNSSCVFIDCGDNNCQPAVPPMVNNTIQYNQFGDATSCGAIYPLSYQNPGGINPDGDEGPDWGGLCNGVFVNGAVNGLYINNNFVYHMEEGFKYHQGGSYGPGTTTTLCNNCVVQHNLIYGFKRIGVEIQTGPDAGTPAIVMSDNAIGWGILNLASSFSFSLACCQSNYNQTANAPDPSMIFNDNLMTVSPDTEQGGITENACECWGVGEQMTNDFMVGVFANYYLIGYGNGPGGFSYDPPWTSAGNYLCLDNNPYSPNLFNNEENSPQQASDVPVNLTWNGVNNPFGYTAAAATVVNGSCSPIPSTASTISPAAGTYTFPLTVTLSNSGTNTSSYYTTDGSAPVPGSGTTQYYSGPFTLTSAATVKVVGMWGVPPQPTSYVADKSSGSTYGFKPSAAATAVYTSSGSSPTLTGISLSGGSSLTVGTSEQITATCAYSGAPSTNCTTTDVYGTVAGTWTSSNTAAATISTGGVLTAVGAGSTNVTAKAGSFTAAALPVTITAAAPTLTGVTITDGGVGTLSVGQTVQAVATAQYNNGGITTNCTSTADAYGTTCGTWTSTNPTAATISSSGLVTAVAVGSASMSVKATNGSTSFTSTPLALTITSNTPPSATLTGVSISCGSGATTVAVGNTLQCAATCTYNLTAGGTTATNCTTRDAYGNTANPWESSATSLATVNSSTGLVTGVANGATAIRAAAGAGIGVYYSNTQSAPLGVTTYPGWKAVCILTACNPGGVNAPASTTQTQNHASPSISGNSMLMSETTLATSTQTNALWAALWGSCDSCTTFVKDFRIYVNDSNASSLEVGDLFSFDVTDNLDLMWGLQCNRSNGLWQIANATSSWTNTSVSCTSLLTTGTWHTVQIADHRVGSTLYWDSVTVDGVVGTIGMTMASTALPGGYASVVGDQFQIDIGATSGTALTSGFYLDEGNFYANNGFLSPPYAVTVTAAPTGGVLGQNQYDSAGVTYPNNFVATYAISPTTASDVSFLNVYLPQATYSAGIPYDIVLVPATSPTAMSSTATCFATYTTVGTNADVGWHAVAPSGAGCGVVPASSAYWVGSVTTGSDIGLGFYDCGNATTGCNGSAPTAPGPGTYGFCFNSVNYGVYTGMGTAMSCPSGSGYIPTQASAYATLTTPNPTLTGGYMGNATNTNTLPVGGTVQMTVFCYYSNGANYQCYPTADQYGNTATGFTSSAPSVATIMNIGTSHPGLVTGIATGTANVSATLTGGTLSTSVWTFTITPASSGGHPGGGRKKHK